MSLLQHSITSGARNFTRNIWLSLTAVTILVVSLSAVGFLSLLSTSLEYAIQKLDSQVNIVVFFQEDATLENVQFLDKELTQDNENRGFEVISTKVFTKEDEKQNLLKRIPGIGDVFDLIGNPLSYKLEIQPKSINDFDSTVTFLSQEKYKDIILSIKNPSSVINNLKRLNTTSNTISFIVIAVFALVSILVMINILRIAVYNRREEIEIMRLVGATNTYIQSPFIVEGVLYNVVAAGIVLAIFIPLTNALAPAINNYLSAAFVSSEQSDISQFSNKVFLNLAINIVAGVVIGVLTIYLAIQRYLKK
jgi:cell division transport system permease protein